MMVKWVLVFIFAVLCGGILSSEAAAQMLRFDPDPYSPVDEQFSVSLVLEANGFDVKGVEAVITYNPALVTLDSITPGPWFTDSGQGFFFWDYTTQFTTNIHFASAILDGTNSSDAVLANCHFTFVDFGSCPLDFTLVDVRDVNNDGLPFDSDSGLIILDNVVDVKKLKFPALKAIFR